MKTILLTFLSLFLFSPIYAQECNENRTRDGEELNVDCGSEVCPTCLPLWYEIICDPDLGTFSMEVSIPDYLWSDNFLPNGLLYELSGGLEIQCEFITDCQFQTIELVDGETGEFELSLSTFPEFDKIGFGQVKGFAACVKADEIDNDCPPDNNFEVIVESVWADSTLYMVRMEMQGGIPPYQFVDNDVQKFYHTQWSEDVYYLGAIPDSVDLNISVYDVNGCQFDIASVSRPEMDFNEMTQTDTTITDTTIAAIQNLPLFGRLDIFPTIFSDQLTVQFEEQTQGKITAFDLTGRTVGSWNLQQVQNQSLEVGQLPAGNYVFALETEKGVYTRLAIKE